MKLSIKATDKKEHHTKKGEKTRAAILDAAATLIEKQGYEETTVRDICALANVTIGSFYNCFPSKSAILEHTFGYANTYFEEIVAEQLSGKPYVEQLYLFVKNYAQLDTDTGVERLKALERIPVSDFSPNSAINSILISIIENGQRDGVFRTDLSAARIKRDLLSMIRGAAYDWCYFNANFDLVERMTGYLDILLPGILASAETVQLDKKEEL